MLWLRHLDLCLLSTSTGRTSSNSEIRLKHRLSTLSDKVGQIRIFGHISHSDCVQDHYWSLQPCIAARSFVAWRKRPGRLKQASLRTVEKTSSPCPEPLTVAHARRKGIFGCWCSGLELPATGSYVGTVSGNFLHSTQDVPVYWVISWHSTRLVFLMSTHCV